MQFGKFGKRLFSAFLALGILLFALPLTAFVFSNVWGSQKEYRAAMQQSVENQMTFSNLSFSIAFATTNDLSKSANVTAWSAAKSTADYYYYGAQIFTELRVAQASSPPVDFNIYITRLDEESFVITQEGTVTKKNFFLKETSIGADGAKAIFEHFKKGFTAYTLPVYDGEVLNEIYYITCRPTVQGVDMLFIERFPAASLFNEQTPFLLFSPSGEIAFSSSDEKISAQKQHIDEYLAENPLAAEFTTGGVRAIVREFNLSNWRVAYLYEDGAFSFGSLLFFCAIVFIGLALLLLLASQLLTRSLYKPVRELMREAVDDEAPLPENGNFDEFAILQKNTRRVKELHVEIARLLTEKEKSGYVKYARDLLFGTGSDEKLLDADFCVGLIEIQSTSDAELFNYKSTLEDCVAHLENAYFVNCSLNCCAVILQTDSADRAHEIVEGILGSCDKSADLYATISDIMHGSKNVHMCYQQALQILQYKYLFDKCDILTMPQVKQVDSRMYYYPLQIENSFIQYLMCGSDGAVILFDELIEENTQNRKLPPEIVKSFFLAIIASIARAFQTMKLTPQELLDKSIDFEELFTKWNDKNIVATLHELVSDIVNAVQQRNKTSDEKIIADMTQYIRENYSRDLMLEDLAHEFNISAKYCSALFKKLSDDTFKNYLNRHRIEVAKDILRKNPSVKTVDLGTMVGFNSAGSFIRVFNKYTGVTPQAFADGAKKQTASK